MTREEAITQLDLLLEYCESMMTSEYPVWRRDCEALQMLIAALRPISREQVEKEFPGCSYCKTDSEGYVRKFGAYSIQNGELETGHCKPQKIKFCPHCSRPLTAEAVDMVMERLEALKDG